VEHVEESFVDAREMIVSSGMVRSGADNDHVEEDFLAAESRTEKARELIGWLHDVSGLQKSQLDNAAKRFNEAVENLISSMAGIGENVQLIGTEMGEVLSDEQEGGSVLDRIDEGASEIVGSMREFTSQGEEISELMGTVAETIKEMSEFVSDIEEVGSEIELISLNASVKAAHTGEEGKALGVLASSIQHLSTDAMDLTGKVTEVLREITAGSRRLEERAAEYVVSQDLEKLVSSQEETTSRLKALNADVVALFEEVSGESRELGTDIRELAEQTDIHHVVEEDLREISGKALQLIREAEQVVPDMEDAARSERLKELLGRYTMEAERLIHEAASSVRQVIAEPDEGFEEPAVAADDSGEIELFDDEPEQEGAEDGVELFDDGVELFGEEEGEEREREEALADERAEQEEEWDNVELF
jgi:methyl-accepting chemotaxis protein